VAETCLQNNIKYAAAVPFLGQEKMWPQNIQKKYHELLEKSFKVQVVSEGGYASWKMHKRNEWIVDNSSIIISYLNETNIKGSGTASCCKYAVKKGKQVINIFNV
jgi:uncharacterized phage-like protein YoqJ